MENATQAAEKRLGLRMDLAFPVIISGDFGICNYIARNVSSRGIFIETSDRYVLGSAIQVTFCLPGSATELTVKGEVKHNYSLNYTDSAGQNRHVTGIGVRFIEFLNDAPVTLDRYIQQRGEMQ